MKDYVRLSKEHFDEMAEKYAASDGTYYSVLPKLACDAAAERLKGEKFGALLDVGCGSGYLISRLAKEHDAEFCGLDISPKMLEKAAEKLADVPRAVLTEGGADALPYPDGTFGAVTCIMSFHHYPYPEKAVEEAYRVLRGGGIYILCDVDKTKYGELEPEAFAAYDADAAARILEGAGFCVTEKISLTPVCYLVAGRKNQVSLI